LRVSTDENLRLIKDIHAPGQSPTQAVLRNCSDDIEWWVAGPPEILPWAGTWHGRDGLERWRGIINDIMEYEQLEASEFIAQGDSIAVLLHARAHHKASGRPLESDIVRIYNMRNGKVVRARSYIDTAAYVAAVLGTPK